jgi:hypothetical protein
MATPRNPGPFQDELARLERGGAPDYPIWRKLVDQVLCRAGWPRSRRRSGSEDVLSALFVRLLSLQKHRPADWGRLAGMEEGRLQGYLRRMAKAAAADLDPDRRARKTLTQLVARVLEQGLPPLAAEPISLRSGGRFCRDAVAQAAAWALADPAGPPRSPGAIAHHLLVRYGSAVVGDQVHPAMADRREDDPVTAYERTDHARRVAAELEARLDPPVLSALKLQLDGEPLEAIARELGCGKTKAHAVTRRWQRECEEVVQQLADEWLAA